MQPDYSELWYWVRERESIRTLKEAGEPQPWTEDPILAKHRFCNVRREDDLVTRWIREHIRENLKNDQYLWLLLCISRQVNFIPTLEWIVKHWIAADWHNELMCDFEATLKIILNDWKEKGGKIYGSAYIIPPPPGGGSKIDYTCDEVIGALWRSRDRFRAHFTQPQSSLRKTHELLMNYNGWGQFLAYQVVVDLRFTDYLNKAEDLELWCAAGPGTKRGLNRLYNRKLDFNLPQEQARSEIRKIFKIVKDETCVEMDFSDVPNILCEYDKYQRTKLGEGTPKSLYVPGRGY